MTCDKAVFAIQQDRIREPEFLDAGRDLRDLLIGVRSGVPGIRHKAFERPENDFEALRNGSYLLRGSHCRIIFAGLWHFFPSLLVFPLCCNCLDDFFRTGIVQRIPPRQRGVIGFFRSAKAILACAENPGWPAEILAQ